MKHYQENNNHNKTLKNKILQTILLKQVCKSGWFFKHCLPVSFSSSLKHIKIRLFFKSLFKRKLGCPLVNTNNLQWRGL
jgi:hypothetical protein